MNDELVIVLEKIFPNFTPYIADRVKKAIQETERNLKMSKLNRCEEEILQGDIFQKIDFMIYVNGEPKIVELPGMILSNTCDITRNNNLLFVPFFPLKKIDPDKDRDAIKKNVLFNIFYIFDLHCLSDSVINFDYIQYIPRDIFEKKIKSEKISSLTQYGFYMFIIKLSVYLMRVESEEVIREV